MLTALGNGEELRHLNHQEDWLKTVVVFGNELLSTTNADDTNILLQVVYHYTDVPNCQSANPAKCQRDIAHFLHTI